MAAGAAAREGGVQAAAATVAAEAAAKAVVVAWAESAVSVEIGQAVSWVAAKEATEAGERVVESVGQVAEAVSLAVPGATARVVAVAGVLQWVAAPAAR